MSSSQMALDKPRHIKYWTRCLKTLLPHQYTSNDSNRMYLAYFIVAALDLLDALDNVSTIQERQGYIDWIYHCQHPRGGFRMWPGTDFGDRATPSNALWDPANLPATYFALTSLLILHDDLKRVNRADTLQWIHDMQRADGSFGETLVDGVIQGGCDPRFGYCATGVRHILRGHHPNGPLQLQHRSVADIDIPPLSHMITMAQSYDGGIADQEYHEPHAGYTFCSLGALAFLDLLPPQAPTTLETTSLIRWLTSLQTTFTDPDDEDRADDIPPTTFLPLGFAGRTSKPSDTCYGFWATASLHLLQEPLLYDRDALKAYLLDKVQHRVLGGFGKAPEDLPDLYHSYLGLAALSLADKGEDESTGLKRLDAGMCISSEVRGRLEELWKTWD